MKQSWQYHDSGPAPGAVNMEIDRRLLADASRTNGMPALRFYSWDPPAVSLGRFQDEETSVVAAACRTRGIDIVRRITGGRAVLHHRELTYSIACPIPSPLFPNDVLGSYRIIAEGLIDGFRRLGIPAEMAERSARQADPHQRCDAGPACFSTPSSYEIVVRGRKLVGSAQRRISGAFLQHGSILIEHDADLEAAVIPGGGRKDAVTSINRELQGVIEAAALKQVFKNSFSHVLGIKFTS